LNITNHQSVPTKSIMLAKCFILFKITLRYLKNKKIRIYFSVMTSIQML